MNNCVQILEGLNDLRIDEGKGIKCDIQNRTEALMCIELIMKDYKITIKDIEALLESAIPEGIETVGSDCKLSLEYTGGNAGSLSLSNISLHNGWGEREIKNTIEDCVRTPESIASTLNAADWIVGKDWKKGAGSNDKEIKLIGTDTFGNKMRLTIKF